MEIKTPRMIRPRKKLRRIPDDRLMLQRLRALCALPGVFDFRCELKHPIFCSAADKLAFCRLAERVSCATPLMQELRQKGVRASERRCVASTCLAGPNPYTKVVSACVTHRANIAQPLRLSSFERKDVLAVLALPGMSSWKLGTVRNPFGESYVLKRDGL